MGSATDLQVNVAPPSDMGEQDHTEEEASTSPPAATLEAPSPGDADSPTALVTTSDAATTGMPNAVSRDTGRKALSRASGRKYSLVQPCAHTLLTTPCLPLSRVQPLCLDLAVSFLL